MLLNRIYQPHVFVHYELIDFEIGDRDVKRLSKALKINTTITKLHLKSEPNNTNGINQQLILNKSTGNFIGDTGATSMSDVLKSNTTLTQLCLYGELQGNNTQTTSINNPLFFIPIKWTDNRICDTGATSLSDVLKSNATLTDLDLGREHKIEQTNGIHQQSKFPFSLNEQTTGLKKRVEYL